MVEFALIVTVANSWRDLVSSCAAASLTGETQPISTSYQCFNTVLMSVSVENVIDMIRIHTTEEQFHVIIFINNYQRQTT